MLFDNMETPFRFYQHAKNAIVTPIEVLNMSGLPAGDYVFNFGVDVTENGEIDFETGYYDTVDVSVTEEPKPGRWVMPTERGHYFASAPESAVPDWGALIFINSAADRFCRLMEPAAIKMPHTRVSNLGPGEEFGNDVNFPWTDFMAYNNAEIKAGEPSMLITANGGKPVRHYIFTDRYATNMGDERFIRYWLDYVHQVLIREGCENFWINIDNGSWRRSAFTPSSGWDAPYPQSDQEYMDSVKFFFRRVKELDPDLKILVNVGMPADTDQFPELFANVDGILYETWPEKTRSRSITYMGFARWFAEQNRVAILRSLFDERTDFSDELLNAYMAYLIARGDNFFFGPRFSGSSEEVPERYYAEHRDTLGWHTGDPVEIQPDVWKRTHEGGIVFLNWSDKTLTLDVPPGYRTRDGGLLTLKSMSGDYVVPR